MNDPFTLIALIVGAVLGANIRYYVSKYFTALFHQSWIGTLFINISGSFLIGIFFGIWSRLNSNDPWRIFAVTGFLGGYTTFSTFSFESVVLLENRKWSYFAINSAVSLGGALVGCYAGLLL